MRTTLLTLLGFLVGCGSTFAAEQPLKVFFIGNSYTHVNDLPGVLAGLADAAGGRKVVTGQHTPGGCTFEKHVQDGKAVEAIQKQNWDVVVFQEQSLMPVGNPANMHANARKLDAAIKRQGARTVFYLTWARQSKPEMQDALNRAYFGIAKELRAQVAPVGIAWQRAMKEDPKLVLYAKDGSHPSAEGTYLAACVFYATLLGKSPEGLPATVKKGGKMLVTIQPAVARRLQTVAWKTVQETNKQHDTAHVPK